MRTRGYFVIVHKVKNHIPKIAGVLGIVSGVASAITTFAYPHKAGMNGLLAGLSLILFLVYFVVYFDAFRQFSHRRSTRMGLNSLLMACSFLFIIILINLISRHFYIRSDWSSTSHFSLAPQTKAVVRRLDHVLRVTAFTQENTPSFKKALDLLEGYRYLNPNIVFSVVDLDREPVLAKEHGISRYNSVLVSGETGEALAGGIDEPAVTNAIIAATRKAAKKVYFVAGHGERSIESDTREGMSKAATRLSATGYQVKAVPLSGTDAVPGDAAAIVIAGPRVPFSKTDSEKLGKFLSHGGKVLALLEPGYDASAIAGQAGITVGTGVIVDPSSNLGGSNKFFPLVTSYPQSPVTTEFRMNTVYPEAAPLLLAKQKAYEYLTIVQAPPTSRLVKRGNVIDSEGNYIVAAAAASKNGRDVLMVFGDSDFVSNGSFMLEGNGNLFLNCINWLAGEAELISIAPRKDDFVPLYLTRDQSTVLFSISLVLLPAAVIVSGAVVWWQRRRL